MQYGVNKIFNHHIHLGQTFCFSNVEVNDDVSTKQFKMSTIVLTGCYFVFILPVGLVELIPDANKNKVKIKKNK